MHEALARIKGGLIVSCQANDDSPLATPAALALLAAAAVRGGAVGIRANGPANIAAIADAVTVPLIAIYKVVSPGSDVYITPTLADAAEVFYSSRRRPEILALDATFRPRTGGVRCEDLLQQIKSEFGCLTMADVSTAEEGAAAAKAGADIVATTLSGYTSNTLSRKSIDGPDLDLVRELVSVQDRPVICEGRVHSPEQAAAALSAGAFAVVVGTAITAVDWVTQQYVAKISRTPESSTTVSRGLGNFLKNRARHATKDCVRALSAVSPTVAVGDARPSWPGHRWGIGQDGSISGIVYHLAAWKEMTLPCLLGRDALSMAQFDAKKHPRKEDWEGVKRWYEEISQSWLDALEAAPDGAFSRPCHFEGHTTELSVLVAEIYEHDIQHTSQLDYLLQLHEAS